MFAVNNPQAGAAGEVMQFSDSVFLLQVAKVVEWLSFNADPQIIVSKGHDTAFDPRVLGT